MEPTDLAVIALGVFCFALVSRRMEAEILTAPMAFTALGLALGGAGLGLIDLPVGRPFVDGLAEVTLALVLFTDAARINVSRLGREHGLPLRMLSVGLPLTILAGTGAALLLFPDLGPWDAALLAVILAPTDAALGQAVVMNRRVPVRIRQALNVESGLNDGLVFPVLLIVVSFAAGTGGTGLGEGASLFARNLLLGPALGGLIGVAGALALEHMNARGWVTPVFLRLSVLALAVLAFAGAETLGGNGFLAAFVAGLLVGTRAPATRKALEDFGEAEGQLLSLLVFLLFGALVLPAALPRVAPVDLLYGVLSLTVLRMLPVVVSLAGLRLHGRTLAFLGWFGPRGLASILYLLIVVEGYDLTTHDDLTVTVCVTVLMSIVAHGVTAAPLARAYGRRMERAHGRGEARPEHQPVHPFALRWKEHRRRNGDPAPPSDAPTDD